MKITQTSATILSALLSCIAILIMVICLKTGGLVATIALGVWLLAVMVVLVGAVSILIDPKSKSIDIGITRDKTGKGSPNVAAWDEYIVEYDNRYKSLSLWLSILVQMVLLSAFIHYGYLYAAIIFVVSMTLCEAAKYRIYKCIKKNKLGWGAAGFIIGIQDFMKDISKENNSTNGEGG